MRPRQTRLQHFFQETVFGQNHQERRNIPPKKETGLSLPGNASRGRIVWSGWSSYCTDRLLKRRQKKTRTPPRASSAYVEGSGTAVRMPSVSVKV